MVCSSTRNWIAVNAVQQSSLNKKENKNMTMKKIAAVVALALALVPVALAGLAGYSFTPIAFLGDPAPGGGNFINDFEPTAINNRGEVAFTADVTTGEGVFVGLRGQLAQIMR